MVQAVNPSLERMWTLVESERSPLWLAMYGGACGRPESPQQVQTAAWSLRHWALDLIDWPVDNTVRYDTTPSPYYPRDADPETSEHTIREIIPPSERATRKPNSDPYEPKNGSGNGEEAPWVFALPYYMLKYYKMLE